MAQCRKSSRQTGSVLQVCLGVDTSKVDLACFREAARILYRRGNDIETEAGSTGMLLK